MTFIRSALVALIVIIFAISSFAETPKVQEIKTDKGIKFWMIEDNYLPIISLKITFTKSGAAHDPDTKQGLANMVSDLMVEGAGGMSGIEYMKQIEELASNITFSVDEDNFYITITCLKENADESLRLAALALKSPNFSSDATQRVKKSILNSIIKQEENPENQARMIFQKNYFSDHPYSRAIEGTAESVNSIKNKDLRAFVSERFSKQNMIIGMAGSIKAEQARLLIDKHFSFLPADATNTKEIPEFIPSSNISKIIRVEKDTPQSVVIFGFPGPKRNDIDFYPSYVENYIFGGGGFESRLMHEVRERRGLAYTVYTSLQSYKKAGLISGYVATKNDSIDESIQVIKKEIEKINENGITNKELEDAKDYLVGSFPLRMTQNATLAAFLNSMQYEGLGSDFLEKRNGYIKKVTAQEASLAAKKYIDTNNMLIVVVGKSK